MQVKTYIQEFLESRSFMEDIARFGLETVEINTLNIERTFIDKIMSIKRHAICGTLGHKVRHIYDVTACTRCRKSSHSWPKWRN